MNFPPLNIFKPVFNIPKRLFVCDIVGDNHTVGTAVVALRDGAEPLLARSVPHL